MEPKNIVLLGFVSSAAQYLNEQLKADNKADYLDALNKIDFDHLSRQLDRGVNHDKTDVAYLMKAGEYAFGNFITEKKQEAMLDDFGALFGDEKTCFNDDLEAQINRIVEKTTQALSAEYPFDLEDEEEIEEEPDEFTLRLLDLLESEDELPEEDDEEETVAVEETPEVLKEETPVEETVTEVVEEETSVEEKETVTEVVEKETPVVEETVTEDTEEDTEDETADEMAAALLAAETTSDKEDMAAEDYLRTLAADNSLTFDVGADDELDNIFREIVDSEENPVLAIIKDMEKEAEAFRYVEPDEIKEVEDDHLFFNMDDLQQAENDFLSTIITNPALDMVKDEEIFEDISKEEKPMVFEEPPVEKFSPIVIDVPFNEDEVVPKPLPVKEEQVVIIHVPEPPVIEEKKNIVIENAVFTEDEIVPKPLPIKEEPAPVFVKVEEPPIEKISPIVVDVPFNEDEVVPKPLPVKEEPEVAIIEAKPQLIEQEETIQVAVETETLELTAEEEYYEPLIDDLYESLEEEVSPQLHIIENPGVDFDVMGEREELISDLPAENDIDVDELFDDEEEDEELLERNFINDLQQFIKETEEPKVEMPLIRETNDFNLDIAGFIVDEKEDDTEVQEKLKWAVVSGGEAAVRDKNDLMDLPAEEEIEAKVFEPLAIHVENYVNDSFDEPIFGEMVDEEEEEPPVEETAEKEPSEEELNDEDYINLLISNLKDRISKEETQRNNAMESKNDTYLRINKTYPYLTPSFVRSVYDLKDVVSKQYPLNEQIILLHRLNFEDVESLRQFVEIVMNHDYAVNVDESKLIVDTFKQFLNTDGKILTNIFEIANQAKLLGGDYDGYRVIRTDKE